MAQDKNYPPANPPFRVAQTHSPQQVETTRLMGSIPARPQRIDQSQRARNNQEASSLHREDKACDIKTAFCKLL